MKFVDDDDDDDDLIQSLHLFNRLIRFSCQSGHVLALSLSEVRDHQFSRLILAFGLHHQVGRCCNVHI